MNFLIHLALCAEAGSAIDLGPSHRLWFALPCARHAKPAQCATASSRSFLNSMSAPQMACLEKPMPCIFLRFSKNAVRSSRLGRSPLAPFPAMLGTTTSAMATSSSE